MRQSRNLKRCYLLLVIGWLMAAAYFLIVTLPLIREKRAQDEQLASAVQRLAAAGHGMNQEEVRKRIASIQADIDAFSGIATDRARTIRFSREVEGIMDRPFQLLDFDHRKFLVLDRIRGLIREKKVTIFEDWERRFPIPGSDPPSLLWAQMTVMDQLIRTAMDAGVDSIDDARLIPVRPAPGVADALGEGGMKVSVQMRLTGNMETIHHILMMLPLNGEELAEAGMSGVPDPKSPFFLSRFVLKKSSTEAPDEVSLEFVASAFLGGVPNS